jgi:hypothetical protein
MGWLTATLLLAALISGTMWLDMRQERKWYE